MRPKLKTGWASITALCSVLAACTMVPGGQRSTLDNPWDPKGQSGSPTPAVTQDVTQTDAKVTAQPDYGREAVELTSEASSPKPDMEVFPGTGRMVDLSDAASAGSGAEGEITLNFHEAEISEVVKTILGDILEQNYVLDENVRGKVHLQTSQPLARDALIPTLETLLQFNGAVLVKSHNFYEVLPADAAPSSAFVPRSRLAFENGYQVLILPLRYIAAGEMMKILEPLKPAKGIMEVDERRNLITVAGTQSDLANIRETVRIFDIDQLQGMSVGLFRLDSVEAGVIVEELEAIFGDSADGPLAGLVKFVPIERLNGLLVITPQRKYLTDVKVWIERLDQSDDPRGMNMYVYYVQNGKADKLAEMVSQLFEGKRSTPARTNDQAANTPAPPEPAGEGEAAGNDAAPPPAPAATTARTNLNRDSANVDVGDVSIIADEENNALLILASPLDYEKVHQAIQKLDVLPLQVLVEATIVEVSLEDELRYGLQWFFKTSLDNKRGRGSLGNVPLATPSDFFPTASFEVFDAVGTRLLLNALAEDSKLNVISSPSLMVLDNHTATIKVGDQVPVRTSETTANASDALNTTSTIQFKDTGVLLEVTPRVNAGGMVVLDITQEVNDVDETTSSGIDSPTIIQRKIDTSVAVQSGETLVLGGLIKENRNQSSGGVPGLRHVPVMGWFFGSEGRSVNRTELVVMITPTAVTDREEARSVTEEYRRKIQNVSFPIKSDAQNRL